jgi:hypothetical protein
MVVPLGLLRIRRPEWPDEFDDRNIGIFGPLKRNIVAPQQCKNAYLKVMMCKEKCQKSRRKRGFRRRLGLAILRRCRRD